MSDLFTAPATATGLDLKSLLGALLLVEVAGVEQGINTVHGPSDAIRANVAVLDGPSAGDTYDDTLIFPKVLQSQLRTKVGGKVLGRLGQGQAKPGQSAPWVLNAATQADADLATQWLTRFTAPAPAAATAPVAQVPAQADADAPPWERR